MSKTIVRDFVHSRPGLNHTYVPSDYYLLQKLVETLGVDRPRNPRWVHVKTCLGHGSGVSEAICDALGKDPYEEIGIEPEVEEVEDNDSGPCLPAGTLVVIGDGTTKPVEDVVDGDTVRTNSGRFQRVANYTERYEEDTEDKTNGKGGMYAVLGYRSDGHIVLAVSAVKGDVERFVESIRNTNEAGFPPFYKYAFDGVGYPNVIIQGPFRNLG